MNIIVTILAFLVALGVLIVIHEFGHYMIARICGVKVLRFSMGFGKPIWKRRIGVDGTEWVVSALPLGGYVKMLDEREGPVPPGELHRAFNRQSVWRRFAIVAAGPIANFLLAIGLYWLLFMSGIQEAKPIVSEPEPETIAAAAGLRRGETILRIAGQTVASWQEVRWRLIQVAVDHEQVTIEVINRRQELTFRTLDFRQFDSTNLEGDPLLKLGLRLYRPDVEPVIGKLVSDGVGEKAGLRVKDRIVAVEDQVIGVWDDFVQSVRARPDGQLNLTLLRDGAEVALTLRPEAFEQNGKRIGRIGAAPYLDQSAVQDLVVMVRYGPVKALQMALTRTWETSVFSLKMLGKMLVGEISWRNLSGPVTIADYAGQSAQLGLGPYLAFLALISISLGVLNLLPVPILDGGHLMYYVVEIAKGSPVPERVMEFGQRLGLSLLLVLMVFAFYNDINRLLSG
ncbi:MAG: RIP metalloprotease RseP [Betaproteobacteria bacterium]|nr:RIP metalloprotease RseP [Betaproteobacteria bacterium]